MTISNYHLPVLLEETTRLLQPAAGEAYFDATAGYGGHAAEIIPIIQPGPAVLVDRDKEAVAYLQERFRAIKTTEIIHSDYLSAARQMQQQGRAFDIILLDLGVSSPQLDNKERGFSFRTEGPLDMRMNQNDLVSALDIVNTASEKELADIIYRYGEERASRRIAKSIVAMRPLKTTGELVQAIHRVLPRRGKIDPATRTFQALRIAVNDELEQLRQALPIFTDLLNPDGRIAVISFHSLEDRLVKQFFKEQARDCVCPPDLPECRCEATPKLEILTKKVISGKRNDSNPRARSAKLRAAMKTKN